jgi:hypothetical protein
MPKGNPKAYSSGYIMSQMKKQGEFNDANESALHREKLDPTIIGKNKGGLDEQSQTSKSASGSIHMKQAGYIMGQSKNA